MRTLSRTFAIAAVVGLATLGVPGLTQAQAQGAWQKPATATNQVASSPVTGGGYPTPDGVYVPGSCGPGMLDSNRSESWLAVRRGTEDLVGTSKFFFDRFSTFYNFHLGSYTIRAGTPVANNQVQ